MFGISTFTLQKKKDIYKFESWRKSLLNRNVWWPKKYESMKIDYRWSLFGNNGDLDVIFKISHSKTCLKCNFPSILPVF